MTTVRGILRSTDTVEAEGVGADVSSARAAAIADVDLERFELQQANVFPSGVSGQAAVKAIARSRTQQPHEATGKNHDEAMRAYRESTPDGWQSLYVIGAE